MTPVAVSLPADLAPGFREAVCALVAEVGLAAPHPDPRESGGLEHRCFVCAERGGKLGGHHEGRRIVWIHRACHRKLHRRRNSTGRQCR